MKERSEPWEMFIKPFFLVLQVIVVVWRDTTKLKVSQEDTGGLAGSNVHSVNNCGDQG